MTQILVTFIGAFGMLALNGCTGKPPLKSTERSKEARSSENRSHIESNVSIQFAKREYSFTVAQAARGIAIEYEVVVEQDIPGVVALPQGSAGEGISVAQTVGDDEKSGRLIPFEKLLGNGQRYGLFDVGLPPPRELSPVTIRQGRYKHSFKWDGRNWNGGSDTSRPKGQPFPCGVYSLDVSCVGLAVTTSGQERFRIANQVEVRLTK